MRPKDIKAEEIVYERVFMQKFTLSSRLLYEPAHIH